MRILALSVAPVFRDTVHGGSQRILMQVADALAEAGHPVRVLCSRRPGSEAGFTLPSGASVEPVLDLRGTFPSPFEVAPSRLANTVRMIQEGAMWADRIYLHADAIFMRDALGGRPLVRSLHDFVYEEALLSAFTLPANLTIVPSQYLKDCIDASLSMVRLWQHSVLVIPNGVDAHLSRPRPQGPKGISPKEPADVVLLHPHRPDERKGVTEALETVAMLKKRLPGRRVRLLIAAHMDERLKPSGGQRQALLDTARRCGVRTNVEFFDWLPQGEMRGLYSFADVTLCLGNFIESFGLVPVESVVAGTAAVCSRVGALRELEGIPGLFHVPWGDIPAAAEAVEQALRVRPRFAEIRAVINARFSLGSMKQGYVAAITGRLPKPESQLIKRASPVGQGSVKLPAAQRLRLAPWCFLADGRIYNDYEYGYAAFPSLATYLAAINGSGPFRRSDALKCGVHLYELEQAEKRGFLIPTRDRRRLAAGVPV